MQTTGYTTLTRMAGLEREMRVVANNIANAQTKGYRQQGVLFSEYITDTDRGSVSMATARISKTLTHQGSLELSEGQFDLGLQGDGYFLIQSADGPRLSRAGAFTTNAAGELVTPSGMAVLDSGGAPIQLLPNASDTRIGQDGTITQDGAPVAQIGIVEPTDPAGLVREGNLLFRADAGFEPSERTTVMQGFLEASNVDPIGQMARLIEVQRAYEMGQSFLDAESDRVKSSIQSLSR
ncbi:MAG: flagellar hook-basal body complex protein [Pseudomonadota bacterium]|nr:flagellar hook-basal body complex protein [Pseudomonadota bacterium]